MSVDPQSAAICDTGLVDLDRSRGTAEPITIDGHNLHDELAEFGTQTCVGHDKHELRMAIIQ